MTLQEFTDRTGLTPEEKDFAYIHAVYLNTSLEKDEFCAEWVKHGDSQIINDVHVRAVNKEMENGVLKTQIADQAHFLLDKSCEYNDPAMRDMAVSLIGKDNVVLYKLRNGLPLWDEDKAFLIVTLENRRAI